MGGTLGKHSRKHIDKTVSGAEVPGCRPQEQALRKEASRVNIENDELNLSGEHDLMPAIRDTGTPIPTPELDRHVRKLKSQAKLQQVFGASPALHRTLSATHINFNETTEVNGAQEVARIARSRSERISHTINDIPRSYL